MRSDRNLVKIIQKYPRNVLEEVSPSAAKLKPFINYPLVYTTFIIGGLAAISLAFFKFLGEILTAGLLNQMFGLALTLTIFGFLIAASQVFILNTIMQLYDQIDV